MKLEALDMINIGFHSGFVANHNVMKHKIKAVHFLDDENSITATHTFNVQHLESIVSDVICTIVKVWHEQDVCLDNHPQF